MSRVVVYSTENCSFCRAAVSLLDKEGVAYDEVKLDSSPESRSQVLEETGGMSFPQIVIDGEAIGGFDSLLEMQRGGALSDLG